MKNYKLTKLLTFAAVVLVTSVAILPTKASASWKQSNSGNWSYIEGNTSAAGWKSIDGKWYFFDSNGIMKTGWILDGSSWYYIAPSGEMKTGWINDGGKWYYTATSGAMQTGNAVIGGINYTFNANGEKISSTATQTTTTNTTQTSDAAKTDSSSSGGSGSSGGGSGSGKGSSNVSYEKLYGTWTVGDYVDTGKNTSLTADQISLCEGQSLTITSNSVSFDKYGVTISNPSVKATTLTSSDFHDKYNVDISGNEVTSFSTTLKVDSLNQSSNVTVFVSDDGESYALLKGALFKLEK